MTPLTPTEVLAEFDRAQELRNLRAELAAYRAAVVPSADYRRALERAEHAERQVDALTAQLADLADSRAQTTLTRLSAALHGVLRTLDRAAGDPRETRVWNEARALVAELGVSAPNP
jgi:hypothetical protein